MAGTDLHEFPIHLGLGATAEAEPRFTGELDWYGAYLERHREDGADARLVSMHVLTESWDAWEMHPGGAEVVLCTAGELTLVQENADGTVSRTALGAGSTRSIHPARGTPRTSRAARPRCSSLPGRELSTVPVDSIVSAVCRQGGRARVSAGGSDGLGSPGRAPGDTEVRPLEAVAEVSFMSRWRVAGLLGARSLPQNARESR